MPVRYAGTREPFMPDGIRISVVIPCFDQGRFLADALDSVLAQTRPPCEIIVVDDGSHDDTSEVASRYAQVRCLRQQRRGLAAARNAGFASSSGDGVVFLDADDRLLPEALAIGGEALAARPACAFVFGHFRYIDVDGSPMTTVTQPCPPVAGYVDLLRTNFIRMHGTVAYRRTALIRAGGFDASLGVCEDYDLYLRIARDQEVACHHQLVAEYRLHDASMSRDAARILRAALGLLRRERRGLADSPALRAASEKGLRWWRECYGEKLLEEVWLHERQRDQIGRVRSLGRLAWLYPPGLVEYARVRAAGLARRVAGALDRRSETTRTPAPGDVRFGDLRRTTPISARFGSERGVPIDRYYIEAFLEAHAADIHGAILEVGDDAYTRRFGRDLTRVDILDSRRVPEATIVADLNVPDTLPADAFDCVILTQTLQLIYDTPTALRTIHRALRRNGVLLATFPGLSQLADHQWRESWYWGFTSQSAQRLFGEVFGGEHVVVEAYGNVLSTTGFLHGLAIADLSEAELACRDRDYELLVTVRARKVAPE